jgi:hypothetical protein
MVGCWARFALAAAVAAALACTCAAKYGFLFENSAVEELDELSLQRGQRSLPFSRCICRCG